jgi:RNA polymerase sigma-70 factor (ECF subfamily)
VTINRAVAVAFADGPAEGLAILDGVADDSRVDRYMPLHAARAALLRRAGDAAGADAAYGRAIELAGSQAERSALEQERRNAQEAASISRIRPR